MSSNKTIAKNTVMLYIRMLISMLVGLYTSRVVLQTLGVEDYGIYGVVGGVVSMMGFLNASMAGATSRFITFELGMGDIQRVRDTFSSAMIIHICIALVVILLAETIGLWFLHNKLVIPDGRMEAAHWVYQCSIISAAVGITQTPYTAVIMSREKMDIYAYMELLNVSLKLGIVYLLVIGALDKLILYSILSLAVSVFMAMQYRIYCIHKFEESKFKWGWNTRLLKPMLSFSGWNLYGNISFSFLQQGRNFVVNMFWGVVYNASCGIATTVQGIIQVFSGNIVQAFRPQIIKNFAAKDYDRMLLLMINGAKISFLLLLMISVPMFIEMDGLLALWLGEVPEFSAVFCRILFIQSALNVFNTYLMIGIHASGNVKRFFYSGTISILQVPVLYLLYRFTNVSVSYTYHIALLSTCVNYFIYCYIVKIQIPQISVLKYSTEIIKAICVGGICVGIILFTTPEISNIILRFLYEYAISVLLLSLMSYLFLLKKNEKVFIVAELKNRLNSINPKKR